MAIPLIFRDWCVRGNSTDSDGVVGVSSTGIGTVGVSNAVGVLAQTASNGYGVYGYASDASGYAGRFRNTDASGISMAVTGQGNPFLAYIGSSATFYGYNGLVAIGDIGQGLSASGGDLTASISQTKVFWYGPDLGVVGYSDNSNNAGGVILIIMPVPMLILDIELWAQTIKCSEAAPWVPSLKTQTVNPSSCLPQKPQKYFSRIMEQEG